MGLPRNAQETTFGTAFEGIEGAFLGCALNVAMGDGLWIMGDGSGTLTMQRAQIAISFAHVFYKT